jgi:sodium transport system permease protein
VLSVPGALALYGFVLAAMMSVGGVLSAYGLPGVAASEWLCIAAPTLAAAGLAPGHAASASLGLRRPRARQLLGATLVGASSWVVVYYGVVAVQELVAPVPRALTEELEKLAAPAGSVIGPLLAVALTPGICEELLCRGAVLSALRHRFGSRPAVLISAVLFGAMHLSPYRFIPTFLLGISFGALAVASRSIFPAMLAHALNNAAVVLASSAGAVAVREGLAAHRLPSVGLAVTFLTIGHILVSRNVKPPTSAGDQ